MKRLFAIALLLAGAAARAQSDVPQVTAHIQPDSVMIGDRFDLVVDVEKDLVQVVPVSYTHLTLPTIYSV